MKKTTFKLACALALLGAMIVTGCANRNTGIADNGDTTSQTSCKTPSGNVPCRTTTHLLHRALVSNYFAGALDVVDATQNRVTGFEFKVGDRPTYLQLSPDVTHTLTLVNNTGSSSLSSFNNLQESVKATIQLGGSTESFVTTVNNQSGFAAVPKYSNGSGNTPGAIVRFNPTDGSLDTAIPFPHVRILALDPAPAEKHLLAFTDADDNAHWVDLTTTDTNTTVPPYYTLALADANANPITLSRPVAAFFRSTSTKNNAYILSCGTECGGSTGASVTEIDLNSITLPAVPSTGATVAATVTNQWPVNGARIGLIDLTANKLYVAGSMTTLFSNDCPFADLGTPACSGNLGGNNVQDGWFSVIDLEAGTASTPLRIGNGVKRWIRNINGTFWVASLNCGVENCVTLVNSTATSASLTNRTCVDSHGTVKSCGSATGVSLAAIKGDSTDDVYTIEGGELQIYDQQGNPVTSEFSTDIRGEASDIEYIN